MRQVQINTIRGYENVKDYYYITDEGKVISKSLRPGILKPMETHKGYLRVDLQMVDGTKRSSQIHRLVALAFVGNLDFNLYPQVNHIDGNKKNNKSVNLEWADNGYNSKHAQELGNWSPERYPKPIVAISLKTKVKRRFPSIRKASIWTGSEDNKTNIRRCLNNKIKQAYGYIWEYDRSEVSHV